MENLSVSGSDPFVHSAWWWPEACVPVPDQYADFSCDVNLPAIVLDHAWLSVTSGSWLTVWANGIWLHHGPLREVAPWQYYDTLDLRPHLVPGVNRLRIRAYHCGVSHQSQETCLAGLLVGGSLAGSGFSFDLSSRECWRAARSPSFLPGAPRLHGCQGFGEHVDLAEDPDAWLHCDADPAWKHPHVVAPHPLPGREKLLPRDLEPFTGQVITASFHHLEGDWQIWSFNGEVFGFITLGVETETAGTCTLIHGESLTAAGLPDYGFSGGDFREILELPAGRRRWTSFEKRALRYLAMPGNVKVKSLSIREYHRPLVEVWRQSPAARALRPRDTAILTAAARTVTLCCDDLLNDCPRRERAQYNDPSIYMDAFPLLFGTWAPIRRWLRQYMRGADPDGVLRMCYPSPPGSSIIPDFSISFPAAMLRYYEATGDRDTLRESYPSAVASVTSFERHADRSGLLCNVPGWVFLCNSFELAKHPRSAALNALWADAWRSLSRIARYLNESNAEAFGKRADEIRSAWRSVFWQDGRILDADSSPEHERREWWNYHYEAERERFADPQEKPGSFVLKVRWQSPIQRLFVAAAGRVRVWSHGHLLLDETPGNPWRQPHPFHPWSIELPEGLAGGELIVEVAWNGIDWEVYLAADAGAPGVAEVIELSRACAFSSPPPLVANARPVRLRPWCAPRYNQITVGYSVASGMLDEAESRAILASCLRADYHVPWLKRTTPIIATPTDDARLIAERAVLCNTPQSLGFFCRALKQYGMQDAASDLCRRIYGAMVDAGSTTLWEEFAPRSSLCHAWGSMCAAYLLPAIPLHDAPVPRDLPELPWLDTEGPAPVDALRRLGEVRTLDGRPFATIDGAWSYTHLHLAIDVADPEHVAAPNANRLWSADSIELGLDTAGDGAGNLPPETSGLIGGDDVKLIFGLIADGPAAAVLAAQGPLDVKALTAAVRITRITGPIARTEYRITLPWSVLGVVGGAHPGIGLDVQVNNRDAGQACKTAYYWGEGLNNGFTAARLQRFVLAVPAKPFTAVTWGNAISWKKSAPNTLYASIRSDANVPLTLELSGQTHAVTLPGGSGWQFLQLDIPAQVDGSLMTARIPGRDSVTTTQIDAVDLYDKLCRRLADLELPGDLHPLFRKHLRSLGALVSSAWARITLQCTSETREAVASLGYFRDILAGLNGDAGEWSSYLDGRRMLVMAFVSPHDKSVQYYHLGLPGNWDETRKYPLFFELHGSGNDSPLNWPAASLSTKVKAPNLAGYEAPGADVARDRFGYRVQPFGRGNLGFTGIARIDVLEVYDHVHHLLKIDSERRYLYGFSMGAIGAFNLALRTPSRWAAVCAIAPAIYYEPLRADLTPNLAGLPFKLMCGSEDDLLFDYHQILKELAAHGLTAEARVIDGLGHSYRADLQKEQIDWLTTHVRRRSGAFTFVTDNNHTNEMWGVRLLVDPCVASIARASVRIEGQSVLIQSEGTRHVSLDFDAPDGLGLTGEVQVTWNNREVYHGPARGLELL